MRSGRRDRPEKAIVQKVVQKLLQLNDKVRLAGSRTQYKLGCNLESIPLMNQALGLKNYRDSYFVSPRSCEVILKTKIGLLIR